MSDLNAAARADNITAIVLAGGQGARLGGQNKGLLTYGEKPLVQHVLHVVASQVSTVVLSANRDVARYAQFGYPVIGDRQNDLRGPLAGIAAAVDVVTTDYVLVVPCDMPSLPRDLVARLAAAINSERTSVVLAHDGLRLQYLVALMRREVAVTTRAFVEAGGRAVKDWLATLSLSAVPFDHRDGAFRNINTADALDSAGTGRAAGTKTQACDVLVSVPGF